MKKAPEVNSPHVGVYLTLHTILRSHASVFHLYNEEFRNTQKGNTQLKPMA
jgi:hypothetical protein